MIQELIEKRKRLHEENVSLLARAQKDGRDVLNAEEEQEWQQRDAAIEALGGNIRMRQKQEQIEAALATVEERKVPPSAPAREEGGGSSIAIRRLRQGQHDSELALRAWFIAGSDQPLPDEHRAAAERCGVDLRNRMLTFYLARRPLQQVGAFAEWSAELRAQGIASGPVGQFTVPNEMMQALEKALLWYGPMRQTSTIVRTETGAALPFPTANDTGNVGAILSENTQVTNQDVTFAQLVLNAFKYSSKQILVSAELMQDNAVNLPTVLGEMLGERIGRIQNTHFTTGVGTTTPFGLVTRAVSGAAPTGTVAAGFTYPNFVDLEHSVDIAYRRMGAAFMMSDLVVARVKKLVDTTGRPLWMPSAGSGLASGQPDTFLGYPLYINNDMASTQTNGTRAVLFGALQKYLVREVLGITLLRLDERYADFHQVAFLAFARADGDLLNAGTNPVKFLAYTT